MKRLLTIILLASSALAGDYYVVPAGTAGNTPTSPYDSWATAANSIADAVGAIPDNNGAVVRVAPGTYAVAAQISVSRSNVEIRSDDGSGRLARAETILDGGAAGWRTPPPTSTATRALPTASASPSPPAPSPTSAATSARSRARTAP